MVFQAIESLRHEVSKVNHDEAFNITMEDILQAAIHDIGFQYDENGMTILYYNYGCYIW